MADEKKDLTYESAYEELESILAALQNDEVNMDEMAASIRRAKELIKFCQSRLRNLETEVGEIFAESDPDT